MIGNRPTPQSQPPVPPPISRAYLGLLTQLQEAGGKAALDQFGRITVDDGRQMLSGQPQDWLRLVAYGMLQGEGDGRTIVFTSAGLERVTELQAGRVHEAVAG